MRNASWLGLIGLAGCLAGSACTSEGPISSDCEGDTCDTPDEKVATSCKKRRADALDSAQRAYTKDSIRWSCADVEGVNTNNTDDRGQEYCEYYAIVETPKAGDTAAKREVLGKIVAQDGNHPIVTPLSIELDDDQLTALEDDPGKVVGSCVFHSWHSDIDMDVAACASGDSCPKIMGYRLDATDMFEVDGQSFTVPMFKMVMSVNSNNAARLLSQACLQPPQSKSKDDYTRGCLTCGKLFEGGECVPWRKSDPTICAGVMRLAECGCGLKDGGDVPAGLVPDTKRGFPLGTWTGLKELPAGCKFVDPGDRSQTIVSCDITAADLIANKADPKGLCRAKYADNVVVHIPIPAKAVSCEPEEDAKGCTATPWLITP